MSIVYNSFRALEMPKRGTSAYDVTEADAALNRTTAYPANAKQKVQQPVAGSLACLSE